MMFSLKYPVHNHSSHVLTPSYPGSSLSEVQGLSHHIAMGTNQLSFNKCNTLRTLSKADTDRLLSSTQALVPIITLKSLKESQDTTGVKQC